MFNLYKKSIVKTRSTELYNPAEIWYYATPAQPEDDTDCDYVAHSIAVDRNNVDITIAEVQSMENFAGWIVNSSTINIPC
jgi:hypothetical protein